MKIYPVNISLMKTKRSSKWIMRWNDPITGKEIRRSTKTTCRETAEVIKNKTEDEVSRGKEFDFHNRVKAILMTNEEKIRAYIDEYKNESEKAKERLSTKKKGGEAGAIAAGKVGIGRGTGHMGKKVIEEVDRLIAEGNEDEASLLIEKLNKSVATTYQQLFKKNRNRVDAIDKEISGAVLRLTRRLDEMASLKGGCEYRDVCMDALKILSKTYDEWRASE